MADTDLRELLDRDAISQPRDEHGRFASSAPPAEPEAPSAPEPTVAAAPIEAPQTPTPPDPVQHRQIPEAALLDERRKRQEYERRLAELEARLVQAQQPAPKEPPADFWSDPQAFIEAQAQRVRQEALGEAEQRMRHQFAEICEQNARYRYQDYDEVRESFLARVADDPVLRAELSQARDPAEFAYRTGKRLKEVEQYGSFDKLIEAERAKIRAELEAQYKSPAPAVPQSLNAEPSPAVSAGTFGGPTPLSELLKR